MWNMVPKKDIVALMGNFNAEIGAANKTLDAEENRNKFISVNAGPREKSTSQYLMSLM